MITFTSNFLAVQAVLESRINRNVERACQHLTNQVKKTLTGQRSGRLYRVAGTVTGQRYQASAPGEPPAVRTGRLRNDIKYVVFHTGGFNVRGLVGSTLAYAAPLEMGTSRIRRRPFLRVTFEQQRLRMIQIMQGG